MKYDVWLLILEINKQKLRTPAAEQDIPMVTDLVEKTLRSKRPQAGALIGRSPDHVTAQRSPPTVSHLYFLALPHSFLLRCLPLFHSLHNKLWPATCRPSRHLPHCQPRYLGHAPFYTQAKNLCTVSPPIFAPHSSINLPDRDVCERIGTLASAGKVPSPEAREGKL